MAPTSSSGASANVVRARVNARSGLRMRSGPGAEFDITSLLPHGALVSIIKIVDTWAMVDLEGDGIADGFVSAPFLSSETAAATLNASGATADAAHVSALIEQGKTSAGLKAAREAAAAALPGYPTNGCAAHLSALLQHAGIDVPMTVGAGKLAHILQERRWTRIDVGGQQPGDVGVCFDNDPTPVGSDHVYLVVERVDADEMMIADNQRKTDALHVRFASGHGKTPTEYFLRAI